MKNEEAFEKLPVPRALARFIIPAVISQLSALILNLTDAFFVGRTGDKFQISAMTITLPLVLTMTVISTVFGAGGNANIAAALGARESEKAKNYSAFSTYASLLLIAAVSALIAVFKAPLLGMLGAEDSSFGYCSGYLLWVLHLGCFPNVFSHVMSQLFSAEGDARSAGIGIAAAGVLNALLDPLFIFVFKLGIIGAGMATCLSGYCCAAYFIILFYRKRKRTYLSVSPRDFKLGDGVCARVLVIGLPAGVSTFLMTCVDFVRNYLLGTYGSQGDFAAWGVVQKLGNAGLNLAIGVAMGARPLVAYNYAASLKKRTRSLIRGAVLIMGVYACLCFALIMLFPEFFVRLFLPIPELMELAVSFLRIYSFSLFSVGYLELFNAIFQAFGKWKPAFISIVIGKICIMAPAMILFARLWDVKGVIAGQPFGEAVTVVMMLILYFVIRKKTVAADTLRPSESV